MVVAAAAIVVGRITMVRQQQWNRSNIRAVVLFAGRIESLDRCRPIDLANNRTRR